MDDYLSGRKCQLTGCWQHPSEEPLNQLRPVSSGHSIPHTLSPGRVKLRAMGSGAGGQNSSSTGSGRGKGLF